VYGHHVEKAPSTNLQAPEKLQAPNRKHRHATFRGVATSGLKTNRQDGTDDVDWMEKLARKRIYLL